MHRTILFPLLLVAAIVTLAGRNLSAVTIFGTAYSGDSGPATLYTINPSSGVATPIGLTGYNRVGAIDFDPLNGVLYGIGTDSTTSAIDLITINTTSGLGMTVGATGVTSNFQDISFRSDGTLFGVSSGQAYTINLTTGVATALPNPTGQSAMGSGLAFDPSNTLYNINGNTIATIDQTTGVGTATGTTVNYPINIVPARPNAMDYDLTTGILYASVVHSIDGIVANFIAEIDVSTGTVTNPRATIAGLDGLAVLPVSSVPDSMSTLWLALPLAGMILLARQRRTVPA